LKKFGRVGLNNKVFLILADCLTVQHLTAEEISEISACVQEPLGNGIQPTHLREYLEAHDDRLFNTITIYEKMSLVIAEDENEYFAQSPDDNLEEAFSALFSISYQFEAVPYLYKIYNKAVAFGMVSRHLDKSRGFGHIKPSDNLVRRILKNLAARIPQKIVEDVLELRSHSDEDGDEEHSSGEESCEKSNGEIETEEESDGEIYYPDL